MLLNRYALEIFKSKCDSTAQGVQCFIHLSDDISEVMPFLNSKLGGFIYLQDPPSLTLKIHGKLLTFHSRKIAINALQDQKEAEKIADWLFREINETWKIRHTIKPSTASASQPKLIEVLKLLPKTNCKGCNERTCLLFAFRVVEGVKDESECPAMSIENKEKLRAYLAGFNFG